MTTYSPPIELRPVCSSDKSPRIEKSPISFGDVSPSTPFDIRSMPPPENSSTTFTTTPNQQQLTSSLSISSDKLISLDTPQQTPTAVNPPFDLTAHKNHLSNAMNDQFIDGNGNGNGQIDKNNSNNNHHSSNTSNGKWILLYFRKKFLKYIISVLNFKIYFSSTKYVFILYSYKNLFLMQLNEKKIPCLNSQVLSIQ